MKIINKSPFYLCVINALWAKSSTEFTLLLLDY